MDLTVVPYNNHTPKSENQNDDVKKNHNNNSNNNNNNNNDVADREPVVMNPSNMTVNNTVITVNYKECMRNHAASLGGHANDGCGEFMPRGTTTTNNNSNSNSNNNNNNNNVVVKDQQHENSLTCAACGCHRNFHRREVFGGEPPHHHPVHLHSPPPMFALYNGGPVAVPRGHPHHHHHHHHQYHQHHGGDHQDRGRSETPERVVGPVTITRSGSTNNTASAKRFRTKFTQEQREKMLEFAEKIGWRIQRHDDVALNQFCSEIGVKRNVLKVWMHNNKNAHRRRESGPDDSPSEPPPPPPQQQEEEQPIGS